MMVASNLTTIFYELQTNYLGFIKISYWTLNKYHNHYNTGCDETCDLVSLTETHAEVKSQVFIYEPG